MQKFLFKRILAMFFIIHFDCLRVLYGQNHEWPTEKAAVGWPSGFYNTAAVRDGYFILTNGDTIRGLIKFLRYHSPSVFNYLPILPTGKNTVINVDRKNIQSIRIYDDWAGKSGSFADYENIENNKNFWRVIVAKNDSFIYDNYAPGMNGNYGYMMILISKTKKTVIFKYSIFHSENINKRVLRFINKQYNTSFGKTYFKTTTKMFNYILNRETENGVPNK